MNKVENQILLMLYQNASLSQRELSKKISCSLGMVNKCITMLKKNHYLDERGRLTDLALTEINRNKPQKAIILAAGLGMRMTPINHDISKGLLTIHNKTIIENTITKLKEKNIETIYIVVGYMKEQYEFLIDKYHVHLLVNNKYRETNNAYSLFLARKYIHNSYIIPCDIFLKDNIFHEHEFASWYLFNQQQQNNNSYKISKSGFLEFSKNELNRYAPLGIAYLNQQDSKILKTALDNIDSHVFEQHHYYWENICFENNIRFNAYLSNQCYEINTFEDLRELDIQSPNLKSEIIDIITDSLDTSIQNIQNITLSKKGMTNRSFLFETEKGKYMMRIPGEGTDQLINRQEEGTVYQTIHDYHIADEVIYFNKDNGYKLTEYIPDSRVCDPFNQRDLVICMKFLKQFHNLNLKVPHVFDLFEKINYYEKLRGHHPSLYYDYALTKKKIYELKTMIDQLPKHHALTHIDAVPDNFLIYHENGEEKIRLIDWEYASMQDTDVDIAMFCIYSMYDKEQCDQLIDIYYENSCSEQIRLKIYCYIAVCGLLWSNWCEYKYTLGVEFGEYSLAQYHYAKDFYTFAKNYQEEHHLCQQ